MTVSGTLIHLLPNRISVPFGVDHHLGLDVELMKNDNTRLHSTTRIPTLHF